MEKIVVSCKDYTIFRADVDILHDVARFVVTENYNHHSSGVYPETIKKEIDEIYKEELSYTNGSECFVVRDNENNLIGCIRVFKWDTHILLPMQKIFHVSPLEIINNDPEASFWHIGRFAIKSTFGFSTVTLFKQLMTLAVTPIMHAGNSYMIAETDCHLLKIMNALGIETRKIADPLIYLASRTIPIYSSKEGLTRFYQKYNHLVVA